MKAKERHKCSTCSACPFFVPEYIHKGFRQLAHLLKNSCNFPDAVPFILTFLHRSLTASHLEYHQAIPFLLCSTTAVIFSVTNLPSLSIPCSIYFFPSHWSPLPAVTDCFSHHLSFPTSLSPHSLPPPTLWQLHNIIRKIYDRTLLHSYYSFSLQPLSPSVAIPPPCASYSLPSLYNFQPFSPSYSSICSPCCPSFRPTPPKAPHALEEVASLQTRKIHLEQASPTPSELSWVKMAHISALASSPSWIPPLSL